MTGHIIFLFCCFSFSLSVFLDEDTLWVVSPNEPEPIQRAIRDVSNDWYKVIGYPPVIISHVPSNFAGVAIYMGLAPSASQKRIADPEVFWVTIETTNDNGTNVVLTGSDVRGTIYAIYDFSEEFLGIDPQWYWIDQNIEYIGKIALPEPQVRVYGPPTFRYRAFFPNDEDLLGDGRPDPFGEQVFDTATWDILYQTALRLRVNMVIVGTVPYPDEKSIDLATKRGLVVTNHHFNLLGINTFRWPEGLPFTFNTSPDLMSAVWQDCINAQKHREMVWSVGYRGLNDYPFWLIEPDLNTPQKRGKLMTEAISTQVQLVKASVPNPKFISYLWAEAADLWVKGYLQYPDDVTLLWNDDGTGIVNIPNLVIPGSGLYYHIAMENGQANQLTEIVPPSRIIREIGYFVQKKATEYLIINTSDQRPVVLTSEFVFKFAWNSSKYNYADPNVVQHDYFVDWSSRHFGDNFAQDIANIYEQYYQIPYLASETPGCAHCRIGENFISSYIRNLAYGILQDRSAETIKGYINLVQNTILSNNSLDYLSRLCDEALQLLDRVPDQRKPFFQGNILAPLSIHNFGAKALDSMVNAATAFLESKITIAKTELLNALTSLDSLFASERAAEYGKWQGWYKNDILTGFPIARINIKQALAKLQNTPIPPDNGNEYYNWYNYQLNRNQFYPYYYNSSESLDYAIVIECTNTDSCKMNPVGGNFTSTALIKMSFNTPNPPSDWKIFFGLNTTNPTQLYTSPFSISDSIRVSAIAKGQTVPKSIPDVSLWFKETKN